MKNRFIMLMVIAAISFAGCGGGPKEEMGDAQTRDTSGGTTSSTGADTDSGLRDDLSARDLGSGLQIIYFDFDKYNLRPDARTALDHNYQMLRDNPGMRIMIEGHCDERGTDEYNLALGERRAKAAKDYLAKLGIDGSRISIISYGEERPVALGHDEDAWSRNRRGEFETE
ncbi:MAG TPA: peptidoglycan-associated lipoprotein Pal [candidate division Zixibacteria bacterium]